tara:strand:+ start:2251 stop:2841 length:591 start_codon:yes stop_codon:yes gene_type:complete
MELKELKTALNIFGKTVIANSKKKLDSSSPLARSLRYQLNESYGAIDFEFYMQQYGLFYDQGVRGKNPSKVSPNSKIKGQQGVGRDIVTGQFKKSPYRFGSGRSKGTFKSFKEAMTKFARKKNIRFRNSDGTFSKGGYESMGYVIASNIYNRGLRGSLFFTDPFMKAYKNLIPALEKSLVSDIENFFDIATKNINR